MSRGVVRPINFSIKTIDNASIILVYPFLASTGPTFISAILPDKFVVDGSCLHRLSLSGINTSFVRNAITGS